MIVKVFVLGLPGSGKSTAARYIEMLGRDYGWGITYVSDYDILFEMFRAEADTGYKKFRPTEHGGFDVLDLLILDAALEEVERRVQQREHLSSAKNELVIIEFARDDYSRALGLFSPDSLRNAYFLFTNADINTCIQRIRERIAHPATVDDYFVSEYILESYYQKDDGQYITINLKADCGVNDEWIWVIDNTSAVSLKDFLQQVQQFVDVILRIPVLL